MRAAAAIRVVLAAVGTSMLAACAAPDEPSFERLSQRLQAASVTARGRLLEVADLDRRGLSVTAAWHVEIADHAWQPYARALGDVVRSLGFAEPTVSETGLEARLTGAGDLYLLRAEPVSNGPPLRVRLRFTGRAD